MKLAALQFALVATVASTVAWPVIVLPARGKHTAWAVTSGVPPIRAGRDGFMELGAEVSGGPDWMAEGDFAGVTFGNSVASAGDVNGDGYDDVIVGAPRSSALGYATGRVYTYEGSALGLPATANWIVDGYHSGGFFGGTVASAGDVNGDGYDDVVVGAAYYPIGCDSCEEGRAYLFLGSASGLETVPAWIASGTLDLERFAKSIAGAGDVDGDGYDDVIVAGGYSAFGDPDYAVVYRGGPSGLSPTPAWRYEEYSLAAVASAGDVNGDGYDDVIVGVPEWYSHEYAEGAALVFTGSSAGLSPKPAWQYESNNLGARAGSAIASAGDVNGDGYDDVIVGAPYYFADQNDEGRALMFLGSAGGLSHAPDWFAEGNQEFSTFGAAVASARDIDADGYDDVVIGATDYDGTEEGAGKAFVYLGSSGGLADSPVWTAEGTQRLEYLGTSVASAGDVDADGKSDVLVGAPLYTDGEYLEGAAFLYSSITCDAIGAPYCEATPNSTGQRAEITAWCSSSVSDASLKLDAQPVPSQFGVFFHARSQTQVPFGNGYLCVTDDLQRGAVVHASGQFVSYLYDNSDAEHSLDAYVGTTRNFQYRFRDPAAGGAFFNMSNGVSVAILP